MAQEKEYFAFISYQRKDEEWADRLRNKLEHYRLPSSVRKQDASLPKEIRPIFRDALELAGGVLAKEIEAALQQSKYLIVICSPYSAKSPWVNKEIQTFIDLGREDRIIPFIIDGTPFSDKPDTECFPPALRSLKGEKELLGININELSRDAASIKVVARMFGLKFDTLWQRYEREKKRKRWMIIGGALLFALVSLGIGGYFIRQNRVIEDQNLKLENAANRLREDSIALMNHVLRIQKDSIQLSLQNDSIVLQNQLILRQRNDLNIANYKLGDLNKNLTKVNTDLLKSNQLLSEERDRVLRANWQIKENLARFVSEKMKELTDDGNAYMSMLLAREIAPDDITAPNKPFVVEFERALRHAQEHQTAVIESERVPFYIGNSCKMIALAPKEGYDIIDVESGAILKSILTNEIAYYDYAVSHHGKQIAVGSRDGDIKVYDIDTEKCLHILKGHEDRIQSLSFTDDDKELLSTSNDKTI